MARLGNDRQELYCYHRAKGQRPAKAAGAAGYATNSAVYSKLEDDPEIVARISELTHEIQTKREQQRAAAVSAAQMVGKVTGLTRAWVLEQLAENVVAARQIDDIANSNSSLEMIDRILKENSNLGGDGNGPTTFDVDGAHALLNKMDEITALPAELGPQDPTLIEVSTDDAIQHLLKGAVKQYRSEQPETENETLVALEDDDNQQEE